jgi:hypothetical protein
LRGKKLTEGTTLDTMSDVTKYVLDEAKMAIVPFYAFGSHMIPIGLDFQLEQLRCQT